MRLTLISVACACLSIVACGDRRAARPDFVRVEITPVVRTLASGTTQGFVATGIRSDLERVDLTSAVEWASSTPGIATIDGRGLATARSPGSVTIRATEPDSGLSGAALLEVTDAVLVGLAVDPPAPSLALGTSVALTATGTFSDGTTQDLTASVAWSTTSAGVATVVAGTVSGAGLGSVRIAAEDAATGIRAEANLTVTAATLASLAVSPVAPSIALGLTTPLTATGTFSDGTTQDLTSSVAWSSSAAGVASVDGNGLVTSLSVGVTTVSATDTASGVRGDASLAVTAATLVSLDVSPSLPSITLGLTRSFVATGTYTDSTTADLTSAVTWQSSAPSIASISNGVGTEGLLTTLAVGTATVSATAPGTGAPAGATTVTVTAAELVSLAVTPTAPSVALGLTRQFVATGTFTDGSTQDLTDSVTWSSSSPGVASISNAGGSEGLATTLAVGVSTVSVLDPGTGASDGTTLTVTAAELVSIAVSPTMPSIALGLDRQFTATGTYTDGSTPDLTATVTWSSSAPSVLSISNAVGLEGLATSLALGSATVTATDPGSGIDGSTSSTVSAATLVSLAITPTAPSIALGLTQQFVATGTFTDGSTPDLTTDVSWTSSIPAVATIDNAGGSEGLATSVGVGSTTITATHPGTGVQSTTTCTVTTAELVSLDVSPGVSSLVVGAAGPFTATGTFTDGSTPDLTDSVTWSSSAPGVATVSNAGGSEGLATAVSAGSATITATHPASGIQGTATVNALADITFVDVGVVSSAALLDLDVPVPVGVVEGDVLLASIAIRPSTSAITAPAGWTLVRRTDAGSGASNSLATYRRTATALEPALHRWTFSASTGSVGCISAFRGVDPVDPIDAEDGTATASALTHATPDVAATVARTVLVTSHSFSSSATWTPPGGMTEAADAASLLPDAATGISLSVHYEARPTAGGTGTRTATASSNADTGNAHAVLLSPGL